MTVVLSGRRRLFVFFKNKFNNGNISYGFFKPFYNRTALIFAVYVLILKVFARKMFFNCGIRFTTMPAIGAQKTAISLGKVRRKTLAYATFFFHLYLLKAIYSYIIYKYTYIVNKNTYIFISILIFCYNTTMVIAQRIKELRRERGLTQAQLALMVGCSQPMITWWEKGECEPTASAILKLSEALECSCDYLLGKTDEF